MRKIFLSMLIMLLVILSGCANSTANTQKVELSDNGFPITPGITASVDCSNAVFEYTVLLEEDYDKNLVEDTQIEVNRIVKEWWNNDSTFKEITIIPIKISEEYDIRGFNDGKYVFIDFRHSDYFTTSVHEAIHSQNLTGLIYSDETGRSIMEAVVEGITLNISGDKASIPTDTYQFFSKCPHFNENFKKLEHGYKNNSNPEILYKEIFGKDAYDVVKTLDYYDSLPYLMTEKQLKKFLEKNLGITTNELMDIYSNMIY